MGRNSSGIVHWSRRGSTRHQLIGCAIALCACIGLIRVAPPASADGPDSTFTPLSTGWLDGAVLDDLIPAPTGDITQYLIGGSAADDGEFPWMTLVVTLYGNDDVGVCGGTLVAPNYVLTAAHCVDDTVGAAVAVGTTKVADLDADSFVSARGYESHPEYVTDGAQADVALLELETPITAPVVQLAHPQDATLSAAGVPATVTGWGLTAPDGELADDLQKGSMPIRSASECLAANEAYIDASNVCAGFSAGEGFPPTGPCLGDSGGPLLVATPDSRALIQVGTVSYGPLSGCVELDRPIVYMRVSFYLDWIEGITGDLAGPPATTTTTTTTSSTTTTVEATTTTTTTVADTTTTVAATTTTVEPTPTIAAVASPTTSATSSFAAPASGSSGGSTGSLAATGSSGWSTFVAWALVALILGRMTVLVARRPAIR